VDAVIHLGRLDTAHGVFPDLELAPDGGVEAGVSCRHAKIYCRSGRFFLKDVGSANGTFLNGKRLTSSLSYPLQGGAYFSSNVRPHCGQALSAAPNSAPQTGQTSSNATPHDGQTRASGSSAVPHSGHSDCPQAEHSTAPTGSAVPHAGQQHKRPSGAAKRKPHSGQTVISGVNSASHRGHTRLKAAPQRGQWVSFSPTAAPQAGHNV